MTDWEYETEFLGIIIRYNYTPAVPPRPGTLSGMDHDSPAFADPGSGEDLEWCVVVDDEEIPGYDLTSTRLQTQIEQHIRRAARKG